MHVTLMAIGLAALTVITAACAAGADNVPAPSQPTAAPASQPASAPASQSATSPESQPSGPDAISLKAIAMFDRCAAMAGKLSVETDSLAWNESYILDAYVSMYEGTGRQDYLDELLRRITIILAHRSDRVGQIDELRGRPIAAWVSGGYSEGKSYAWMVHAGMITAPMARLAYVLKRDPVLAQRYEGQIRTILADVAEVVHAFDDDFREGPGTGPHAEGYYYCRYLQCDQPFNQQNAIGRTMIAMYLATGDEWYRDRVQMLAKYYRARIQRLDDDKRFCWAYWPRNPVAEDVSHAAINVDFAVQCRQAGIVFNNPDMRRFVAAFNTAMNGPNGVAHRVDGSGDGKDVAVQISRWGRLGWFDPAVRRTLSDYIDPARGNTAAMVGCGYLVQTQSRRKELPVGAATQPSDAMTSPSGAPRGPTTGPAAQGN